MIDGWWGSIVRTNLMVKKGYVPYCGNMKCPILPRAKFNGEQFECSVCGWKSSYEKEFIDKYKALKKLQQIEDVECEIPKKEVPDEFADGHTINLILERNATIDEFTPIIQKQALRIKELEKENKELRDKLKEGS